MNTHERLIGQKLGQYEVRSLIAQGGMATVYLAYDEGLQRDVALKVLLSQFTYDNDFVERFQREARTAARLRHPHTVQIYATGNVGGDYYIAMEYIAGNKTLADVIKALAEQNKWATVDYALAVCRQIADALDEAHQAGIVHRDLKPSNILLGPNGKPYVTDLGVAVVRNDPRLTRVDTLVGTPDYMSPEQARSEAVDGRSDIYALGVILYELLAGRRPFTAESSWTVIHKHLTEAPVPLAKIRQDLAREIYHIVEKCLQKSPEARFQTARELVAAIDAARIGEGIAEQVSDSGRWWQPTHTGRFATSRHAATIVTAAGGRRRWLYGSSVFVLLLIGLGIWQLWLRPLGEMTTSTPASLAAARLPASATASPGLEPTSTPAAPTSTPRPSPTAAPARPLFAPEAQIALISPTAADEFVLSGKVTFSWSWPITMTDNQRFFVYLVDDGADIPVNVGFQQVGEGDYDVEVVLGEYITEPDVYAWKVRLEDSSSGDVLRESSVGTVKVVTTRETPTATITPTPTLTPTATLVPATATRISSPTPVPPTPIPPTPVPPTPVPPTPIPPTPIPPPTVTPAPAEGPTPTPAPP